MYTMSKEFSFSASHILEHLPEDHPCSRLHGHNYVVIVEFSSTHLDKVGFVIDYQAMQPIKRYIDCNLDHRHLNDVFSFNPTAELMAAHLFDIFKDLFQTPLRYRLFAVTVKETPKTTARFEP